MWPSGVTIKVWFVFKRYSKCAKVLGSSLPKPKGKSGSDYPSSENKTIDHRPNDWTIPPRAYLKTIHSYHIRIPLFYIKSTTKAQYLHTEGFLARGVDPLSVDPGLEDPVSAPLRRFNVNFHYCKRVFWHSQEDVSVNRACWQEGLSTPNQFFYEFWENVGVTLSNSEPSYNI